MEFRSTLAVSLVVVLVLLSGCSGLVTDDGNGATSPEEFEYADGYSADGINDSEAAAESYQQALTERSSFAVEYNQTLDEIRADVLYRVDQDNEVAYHRVDVPEDDYVREEYYTNDSRVIRQASGDNEQVVTRESSFDPEAMTGIDAIAPLLSNTTAYETTTETHDGTTVAVYEANGVGNATEVFDVGEGNVTAFSARFAVDSSGLIHEASYELSYLGQQDQERSVSMTFTLSGINETTVERPEWANQS